MGCAGDGGRCWASQGVARVGLPATAGIALSMNTSCAATAAPAITISYAGLFAIGRDPRASQLLDLIGAASSGNAFDTIPAQIQEYAMRAMLPFFLPGVALAIFFAVCCWPTLWIGRCCAHKCWAPRYGVVSTRKQKFAFCRFACLWVLVAMAIALAGVAGGEIVYDTRRIVCAAEGLLSSASRMASSIASAVDSLQDGIDSLDDSVTATRDAASALRTTLAAGGEAAACCGYVTAASDAAAAIAAAAPPSSPMPASFTSAQAELSQASTGTVCDLAPFEASLDGTVGTLDALSARLGDAAATGTSEGHLAPLSDMLYGLVGQLGASRDAMGEVAMAALWTSYGALANSSGVLTDVFAILCLLVSLLGVCCLRCRRRPGCCTLNQIGVQTVGVAWVSASFAVVAYFLVSAGLLVAAAVGSDASVVLRDLPHSPSASLGPAVCGNISLGATASLSPCDALSTCFSAQQQPGAGAPSLAGALTGLGLAELDAGYLSGLVDQTASTSTSMSTSVSGLSAGEAQLATATTDASGLTPEDFGVASASADEYASMQRLLVHLSGNLTAAADALVPAVAAAGQLNASLPSLGVGIGGLSARLTALHKASECGWLASDWSMLLAALTRAFEVGIASLAFSCGYTALLLALWIGTSIVMQIRYGDVGRGPGCPSMCRCCCPAGVARSTTRAAKVEMMSVRPDGDVTAI